MFDELPRGGFKCITADPPWNFKVRSTKGMGRSADMHYQTMSLADIATMPVDSLAARDAWLFLWATGPCLDRAFDVMDEWGFQYSGMGFVWVKLKKSHNPSQLRMIPTAEQDLFTGLGYTTRKNAEFCLLGRRGAPKRIAKDVREVILSPVRRHSEKPDEFFERVERYCEGPYLELFSRKSRPNWTTWGQEKGKFDD